MIAKQGGKDEGAAAKDKKLKKQIARRINR